MTAERFPQKDVDELLTACNRRCRICHRFCGVKIETDHMLPRDEGGQSTIDNAIAGCFECMPRYIVITTGIREDASSGRKSSVATKNNGWRRAELGPRFLRLDSRPQKLAHSRR